MALMFLNKIIFTKSKQKNFLEDVYHLVKDGVPMQGAIETLNEISTGINKEMSSEVLKKISEGRSIAESLRDWFSPVVVEMIRNGEDGGTLLNSLSFSIKYLTGSNSFISSFVSSLTYPFVVFLLAMVLIVYLKGTIFVNFLAIKPLFTWPEIGRFVYNMASFIENYWGTIIISLMAFAAVIYYILLNFVGANRKFIDKLPFLHFYRDFSSVRFVGALGLLLSNSVTLKRSLALLKKNASKYIFWHISLMELKLSGGIDNVADVLDTGLIRKQDVFRLKAIAKTKGFDDALIRLSDDSLRRLTKEISFSAKVVGGLLLFIDAMIAIMVVLAIYGVGATIGGI